MRYEATIVRNGATWTIRVRGLFGHPQVFHVDSQYKNSAWVKRVV